MYLYNIEITRESERRRIAVDITHLVCLYNFDQHGGSCLERGEGIGQFLCEPKSLEHAIYYLLLGL